MSKITYFDAIIVNRHSLTLKTKDTEGSVQYSSTLWREFSDEQLEQRIKDLGNAMRSFRRKQLEAQ